MRPTTNQPAPLIRVVDNDPAIRAAIQWILDDEGFAVALAADGQQGVRATAPRCPHDPDHGRLTPHER